MQYTNSDSEAAEIERREHLRKHPLIKILSNDPCKYDYNKLKVDIENNVPSTSHLADHKPHTLLSSNHTISSLTDEEFNDATLVREISIPLDETSFKTISTIQVGKQIKKALTIPLNEIDFNENQNAAGLQ